MDLRSELLEQLDALIADGNRLAESYQMDGGAYWSPISETEFRVFSTAALAAIERIASRTSEYYQCIPKDPMATQLANAGFDLSFIPALTGALRALRNAVEHGLLSKIESRLRANIHDDFLVQASHLLQAGYHVAAIVLIGGVLENHLLKLAQARNLSWTGDGSLSKYNDLLRDAVYPQPTWRRIQSVGDCRNDAAHGRGAVVNPNDVADALTFVQRFLVDQPS